MEWLVRRMFSGGRVLPVAMRNATQVRGRLIVEEQTDRIRNRRSLVARLLTGGSGPKEVLDLWDAALVSANDSLWVLTGHERVIAGVMREETFIVQTWWAVPAPLEDLAKAEAEWARLAGLLQDLQAPAAAPGAPPS